MGSHNNPDVVIIGGGAAGSSAALVLGRARFDIVVLDAGQPSNAPSTGIGGLLGNDGTSPTDFYQRAEQELASYPSIERRTTTATAVRPGNTTRWIVETADEDGVHSDRILLAMGMHYELPDIDGIEPRWGSSVFHCPFCHGWEHRGQPLAVLGGPPERALLLRQWTNDVTLITNHEETGATDRYRLQNAGIRIVDGKIHMLEGPGRSLERIQLDDDSAVAVTGLMVPAPHQQRHPPLLDGLALHTTQTGHMTTDDFGATSVPGIWAAGDLTHPASSVARAIAGGSNAAISITHNIVIDAAA